MIKRQNLSCIWISLIVVSWINGVPALGGEERGSEHAKLSQISGASPHELYHQVWQLINDDYYDTSYNKQHWSQWEHQYDGKLKTLDDAHLAIMTMLASLHNPDTRFIDAHEFAALSEQKDGNVSGIGVQIGMNEEHAVFVLHTFENSPAERADIRAGDEIAEVNGRPVKGQSIETVAAQIMGPVGTSVSMTLRRHGQLVHATPLRSRIKLPALTRVEQLQGNIGYIRIDNLDSETALVEIQAALTKLSGVKGLILDLRTSDAERNLSQAIDVANTFVRSGCIVNTVDRDGYLTPAEAIGKPDFTDPLEVLIDRYTKHSTEILAAALQQQSGAKLIGERSYGAVLVQGMTRLEDGSAVSVSIASWLPPDGVILNKGIEPDVEVKLTPSDWQAGNGPWWIDPKGQYGKRSPTDGKDIQLEKALDIMRNSK